MKPKPGMAFLMSLLLGAIYAATSSWFYWEAPFSFSIWFIDSLLVGVLYGIPVGFMCSPIVVILLSKKNLVVSGLILLIVVLSTYPLINLGTPWTNIDFFPGVPIIIVIVFLLSCKVISMLLPNIVYDPPFCKICGYYLCGLPKPRCPECGTPFDPSEIESLSKTSSEDTAAS